MKLGSNPAGDTFSYGIPIVLNERMPLGTAVFSGSEGDVILINLGQEVDVTVKARETLRKKLDNDERAAWAEYLDACKGTTDWLYEEREPWAWARLQGALRTVRRGRRRLVA